MSNLKLTRERTENADSAIKQMKLLSTTKPMLPINEHTILESKKAYDTTKGNENSRNKEYISVL